jgi:hypothetical protein
VGGSGGVRGTDRASRSAISVARMSPLAWRGMDRSAWVLTVVISPGFGKVGGHLRPEDLVHLCRGQASPGDLSGAKATHGPGEPCVPDTWLRCLRGIDGLSVIDRPQRRPKRRDRHGVPCLHRIRKHGAQAIPHGPGIVICSFSQRDPVLPLA